jgi:hypothetical protein
MRGRKKNKDTVVCKFQLKIANNVYSLIIPMVLFDIFYKTFFSADAPQTFVQNGQQYPNNSYPTQEQSNDTAVADPNATVTGQQDDNPSAQANTN